MNKQENRQKIKTKQTKKQQQIEPQKTRLGLEQQKKPNQKPLKEEK